VQARIVAKWFTEPVTDIDNICASTPIYSVLRLLLTLNLNNNCTNRRHFSSIPTCSSSNRRSPHVSTNRALQQSRRNRLEAQQNNLRPEKRTESLANSQSRRATAAWSTAIRSRTQHLLYTQQRSAYILVYVDDLLLLGDEATVNKIFEAIQQHFLLRPTGTLTVCKHGSQQQASALHS